MLTETQPSREWWAQRWIDVLESFGFARRLARARVYAREGNVLSIDFKGAKVTAKVQGTAPDPYKVTLSLDPFDDEQWGYVVESMAQRAIFSAKLLAGEMPQDIEQVFTANGLSLFPFTKFDIHSRCTCPDPANPCKHIGAVYYLLGDRFSEDPFILFQLRGRTQEQIIAALRQIRSQDSVADVEASEPEPQLPQATPIALDRFWSYAEPLEPSLSVILPPQGNETVLDVLGDLPLRPNSQDAAETQATAQAVREYLKAVYENVRQQALIKAMSAEG
jgi:uncharacterized Zn finger protein